MFLFGTFAIIALVLASIGIYGVLSYLVGRRTPEIGIRMALGAQRRQVMRLVLFHGAALGFAGVSVGIVAALLLTRLMSALLYGVRATDPLAFGAVAVLLSLVILVACYIPARRAMHTDPMVALRYE
jgi:putative ABC transport system permease protein